MKASQVLTYSATVATTAAVLIGTVMLYKRYKSKDEPISIEQDCPQMVAIEEELSVESSPSVIEDEKKDSEA
jgi:hypothetical protein